MQNAILNEEQFVLDSNFWISLLDAADVHHGRAKQIWSDIAVMEARIFLTDVAVNEILSVMARRFEERKKEKSFKKWVRLFRKRIEAIPILCLYELLPNKLPEVIGIMTRYRGCFNFHDALLILFLGQLPKVNFVSFDKDFEKVGQLRTFPVSRL